MSKRLSIVAMSVAVAVALAAAMSVNASPIGHINYLTFRAPVSLPGLTLPAGTYRFEIADTNSSRDIVMVSSRDRSKRYFAGFTQTVARPAGLRENQSVVFGEAPSGAPAPISVWYPLGESVGQQFIYWR